MTTTQTCPTCGHPRPVHDGDEGTSGFVPPEQTQIIAAAPAGSSAEQRAASPLYDLYAEDERKQTELIRETVENERGDD